MANEKISTLPAVASLTGAELFETVQSGGNYKVTLDDLFDYIQPILGDGTVGQIVKVKTINGGGNIILLEDSHTNEGADLIRTEFIGGLIRDYQIAIGDGSFEGGRLFIHGEGSGSSIDLTAFDSNNSGGIVFGVDTVFISVKDLVGIADLTSIILGNINIQYITTSGGRHKFTGAIDSIDGFQINSSSYNDGLFFVDGGTGVGQVFLGDYAGGANNTYIQLDDTAETIGMNANNGVICYTNFDSATYSVGGTAGDDGTFTTVDLKTVTVTKGIITAIV